MVDQLFLFDNAVERDGDVEAWLLDHAGELGAIAVAARQSRPRDPELAGRARRGRGSGGVQDPQVDSRGGVSDRHARLRVARLGSANGRGLRSSFAARSRPGRKKGTEGHGSRDRPEVTHEEDQGCIGVCTIGRPDAATITEIGLAGPATVTPSQQTGACPATAALFLRLPQRARGQYRPESKPQTDQNREARPRPRSADRFRAHLDLVPTTRGI